MVETLLELAQEAPVRGRADFLDRIRAFGPKASATKRKSGKDFAEALLEQIAVLREKIEERIGAIENGNCYENPVHWDEGGYDEEEPDYVTPEQTEELENLFLETGGIFLDGRKAQQGFRSSSGGKEPWLVLRQGVGAFCFHFVGPDRELLKGGHYHGLAQGVCGKKRLLRR